jgi:hypothetical protein
MTIVGLVGAFGVTGAEDVESGDHPAPLRARTVKVWATPLVSPSMVQDVVGAVARHTFPPGDEATL